ncbi:DHA2 family efflux MFS transporter permease subunit [Geomonas sp.]|uniref:DHA2 family efflux MFS transporter permease subunit n=1 Tax=Geomonas sp. TaxID=2651584 RepID=UPI002B46F654|nr:DHA2 family efflux MFS transporter permease subunit [Geomonas sp.]HJV34200.1 DHA2 family efflux MFS transporter permease subunit [Geomonas sp.]
MNERRSAARAEDSSWRPAVNPWLITAAVMLATFMEVLDTTIVSVALPHIAGSLSATTDEATWVLTSYLVSNAIVLPASGWFARYFGRKRFLIVCIIIFTISSFVCGIAGDLAILVIARVLQGAGGGALQPLSQAILLESFPPEKRGMAMAAFAIGVVVAPILGPTLGGWLTDQYSWRWAFYINIPIGAVAVFMVNQFVEDPPYIRKSRPGKIDATGFALMAVCLATMQVVLDRGQQVDWFSAPWLCWFTAICICCLVAFVIWEIRSRDPIVNLAVFCNRNFLVGTSLIFMVGISLYAALTLLPLYLQTLMGYPALQSGMAVSPRGLGAFVMMPLVGYLTGKVDVRKLVGGGFVIVGISLWQFAGINLDISMWSIVWPSILTGVGLSMIFVPLSTVTMGTLAQEQMGNASGIFNLMRNVGGSVGISMVTALLARQSQVHQSELVSRLTRGDFMYLERGQSLQRLLERYNSQPDAMHLAQAGLYGQLQRQATLLSYVNDFRLLSFICFLCVGGAFLLKRVKAKGPTAVH